MSIIDSSFYDKDIYNKKPTTPEEAEVQLTEIMDDLTDREEIVKKKFRFMVAGLAAAEVSFPIIASLLGCDPSVLNNYAHFLTLANAAGAPTLVVAYHNLKAGQKYYQKIKEKIKNKELEDVVGFTNDMIDKAMIDKGKGR